MTKQVNSIFQIELRLWHLLELTQVATYQKPSQNKLKAAYLSAKQRFFCIKI
jgi:hypothetical protein